MVGQAASEYRAKALVNPPCKVIECDEIWSFCYSEEKNIPEDKQGEYGFAEVWTWSAIDTDYKLVPTWLVGERTLSDAYVFLSDLKSRLKDSRTQLTTDGLRKYLTVLNVLWANDIDFAMPHKIYGSGKQGQGPDTNYGPAIRTGIGIRVISDHPDMNRVSTPYVERQNLTMQMGMRCFTRLTNGFSKKMEFHAHAVNQNFMSYNFARTRQNLRVNNADGTFTKRTPATAAGIADHVWTRWEMAELLD